MVKLGNSPNDLRITTLIIQVSLPCLLLGHIFIPTTASLPWNLLKPGGFAAAAASSLHRSCAASCMLCSQAWWALPNLGMHHLWGAVMYRCMTSVLLPSMRSLNWFADFCWNLHHSIHTELTTHYYVVALLLDSLANLSFSAGVFPMCYKVSHIVQLLKKAGLRAKSIQPTTNKSPTSAPS